MLNGEKGNSLFLCMEQILLNGNLHLKIPLEWGLYKEEPADLLSVWVLHCSASSDTGGIVIQQNPNAAF